MKIKPLLSVISLAVLVGCGGGGDSKTELPKNDEVKVPEQIPEITKAKVSTAPLTRMSEQQFATHLKNGVFKSYQDRFSQEDNSITVPTAEKADSAGAESQSFSTTNQQETNVDEADRIKYNGNYMYIAANAYDDIDSQQNYQHYIRILKRSDSGEISHVTNLNYSKQEGENQQLYLRDNLLTVLNYTQGHFFSPFVASDVMIEPYFHFAAQEFELTFIDTSSPEQASIRSQYKIDGTLIDSRVIDNQLYLISNFNASYDEFNKESTDEAAQLANYQKLYVDDIEKLLPSISLVGSEQSEPLVSPDNCYISEDSKVSDGFDNIMTLTRINLADPTQRDSLCINSRVSGIYASENALYAYGSHHVEGESNSVIHKFSFNASGLAYEATGEVEGHFGRGQQNLRFSEYNNGLRVVTSKSGIVNDQWGFDHKLFVLEQQGNTLAQVSQLPNESQPTPIGKVNENGVVDEDIYAVRFAQDKAYIVTFRQVDPLYVIDLKDKAAPYIAGALEIPGYSAYLHPINDSLLLGIGQNIRDWRDPSDQEVEEGAKVTLFDISDISKPTVINEKVFENAYSPAEWEYKSLSFLATDNDTLRFTMPVERWRVNTAEDALIRWVKDNELALFEITKQTPELKYIGSSQISYKDIEDDKVPYVWGGLTRSVIHSDDVYHVHGNYVWHSIWQAPADNTGPF